MSSSLPVRQTSEKIYAKSGVRIESAQFGIQILEIVQKRPDKNCENFEISGYGILVHSQGWYIGRGSKSDHEFSTGAEPMLRKYILFYSILSYPPEQQDNKVHGVLNLLALFLFSLLYLIASHRHRLHDYWARIVFYWDMC